MSHARPRRRITLIALTVVLALVLTSCFNGDDETDETTTTTTQQSSTPQTTAEAPATTQPPVVEPATTTSVIVVTPTDEPEVTPPEPPPPPPPDPPVVDEDGILLYTVQAGDTLFSIAQRFGVSLDDLVEANNISNPDEIFVDETLTIPPTG